MPPTGGLLVWDVTWGVLTLLAGFLVVSYRWWRWPGFRRWADRHVLPLLSRTGILRWDWWQFTILVAIIFAGGALFQIGPFPCSSGTDDVGAFLASGQAALSGGNPFLVEVCGGQQQVPYGILAVGLNALGSLGGRPGIWAVWDAIALLLVPLFWFLAGPGRRYVLAFVISSVLFIPIVTGQIDGSSNALVPVGLLLPVALLASGWAASGGVAGLIATARFPSIVPFWSATSSGGRRGFVGILTSGAVFLGGVAAATAIWGSSYLEYGIAGQLNRESFSLNLFGLLFPTGWVAPGIWLTGVQVVLVLVTLIFLYWRGYPALHAAGIGIVVVALTTQFLSFNFLIWLLPVALLGDWPRRWLYVIGLVGAVNYSWALAILADQQGIWWPSEVLAVMMTALLIGLLVTLLIEAPRPRGAPTTFTAAKDRMQAGAD